MGNTFGAKGFSPTGSTRFTSLSKNPNGIIHKTDKPDVVIHFLSRCHLGFEILVLCQQLEVLKRKNPRPCLRRTNREFWILLSRLCPQWSNVLVIVKPYTVGSWHRMGFRLFWQSSKQQNQRFAHTSALWRELWDRGNRRRRSNS